MKKIVLLGDSIRLNYCDMVKEDLTGKAEVVFPRENCRFIQYLYQNLLWWCPEMGLKTEEDFANVALVHYNSGHWDAEHFHPGKAPLNSIPVYTEMLLRTEELLEEKFPNAKIVFATTTPMNPDAPQAGSMRTSQTIAAYNEAAKKTLAGTRAEINDMWAAVEKESPEIYADYCHFTEAGARKLADTVKKIALEAL